MSGGNLILWWPYRAYLTALNAVRKALGRVRPFEGAELLQAANASDAETIVGGVGEAGKVVGHQPVRRVVGAVYAGRPRFGKRWRMMGVFEELVKVADLYEEELGLGVVRNAPEVVGGRDQGNHHVPGKEGSAKNPWRKRLCACEKEAA